MFPKFAKGQCTAETERYQQLMEAARSRKRGKQPGQKQAKAAEKSAPDPELVKTNAAIEARSRALELAKSKQQKAQQQLRRKKLVELHKGKTIVEADVDEEGMGSVSPCTMIIKMFCSIAGYNEKQQVDETQTQHSGKDLIMCMLTNNHV